MQYREYAVKAIESIFKLYGQPASVIYEDNSTSEITIIHRLPDKINEAWDSNINSSTNIFELKKSDIDENKPIKQISLNEKNYLIQGDPILDKYGLILRFEAYEN